MIDDDDFSALCRLARAHDEALFVKLALLPVAVFARRRHTLPDCCVLGYLGEVRTIAALRNVREALDLAQLRGLLAAVQASLISAATQMIMAYIVGAALEQRKRRGHLERVTHGRKIALEQLVLQRFGSGGNNHFATAQQRRHEVGKCLSRARAGFGDEAARFGHGGIGKPSHLCLLRPHAVVGYCPRERTALGKQGFKVRLSRRYGSQWLYKRL